MTTLIPNRPVPSLDLPLEGGGRFVLSDADADYLNIVAFYRGLHCPICRNWLQQLDGLIEDFGAMGIKVVAASMDSPERIAKTRAEWNIDKVPLAHGMSEATAREWGLFISTKRDGSEEPDIFSEPGLFLVRPDGTLYASSVQSMPFTRPDWKSLLGGLEFIKNNDYPARGDAT